MAFGELLRRYRTRARLSQEELAERAGLSVRAISDLERGRKLTPRNATVRRLVAALGLSDQERESFEVLARPTSSRSQPPSVHIHTLPSPLTPFIGREGEVDTLQKRLLRAEVRLLTLIGPGGAGKTRLALRLAEEVGDHFADGVVFVSLASVANSDIVLSAITQAVGVHESSGQSLVESVEACLQEQHVLLVLDNFEHVVLAGRLVARLLSTCPKLKVLVTSRVVLRVSGEHTYAVPQLRVPARDQRITLEQVSRYEAVQLFVARAQEVKPEFTITEENAAAVAQIVAKLEGLPLAIELAAAWIRVLSPQMVLARLHNGRSLLTGGPQDLPIRQQTLRATLDWSYTLLGAQAQTLLRRLAVFPAGCTLEAVEAVYNSDESVDVLEAVAALVDSSLLWQEAGQQDEVRFRMLETIREYALARLAESGESETVHRLRRRYYLAMTQQAERGLQGPEQRMWLQWLDDEIDNLRAVLGSLLEQGDVEDVVSIGWGIWWFWFIRGQFTEGQQWIERALAGTLTQRGRVQAQTIIAAMAFARGNQARAAELLDAGIQAARDLDDREVLATALLARGNVSLPRGELERATACAEESAALFRDQGNPYGGGLALNCAVHAAMIGGDLERAEQVLDVGESLFRAAGAPFGVVAALNVRVMLAQIRGDYVLTVMILHESIALSRSLHDTFGVFYGLISLAGALAMLGESARAAHLFGAADALRAATGTINAYATSQALYEQQWAVLRAQLDPVRLAALHAEGRAMTFEQALDYALY